MVSQTGPRVVRSNSCKGPVYPGKGPKKGQTKILGPTSVIWGQRSEIWPQKGQPGNPGRNIRLQIFARLQSALSFVTCVVVPFVYVAYILKETNAL